MESQSVDSGCSELIYAESSSATRLLSMSASHWSVVFVVTCSH